MARARGRPNEAESLRIAREALLEELTLACATAVAALSLGANARNRQLEDSFFRGAAAMEGFLSEWVVRCLSFDTSQFLATTEAKAKNQAMQDLGRWEPSQRLWRRLNRGPLVGVRIPIDKKISLSEAREYLGWGQGTHSFRDARDFETTANDVLIARVAQRASTLTTSQQRILDATIAIRNVLAHRSTRGVTVMNSALTASGLPAALRRTGNRVSAKGVGNYLRADAGGRARIQVFIEELVEVAYVLAPGGTRVQVCPQLHIPVPSATP